MAFSIPHTLRASLDARFTMAVSVFSMWAFRIGFAYLFVYIFKLGVMGIWYGMFIDWIFRAVGPCMAGRAPMLPHRRENSQTDRMGGR